MLAKALIQRSLAQVWPRSIVHKRSQETRSCAQQPLPCESTQPPTSASRDWPRARAAADLSSQPGRSKEYLDVNEWQVAGVKQAIASLDRGEGVSHEQVKDWITSRGSHGEQLA